MPAAAPYFNKASIESGPGVHMIPKNAAAEMTSITLRELNIAPKDWKKLLELPAADLLAIQLKMPSLMDQSEYVKKNGAIGFVPNSFQPVVDGVALPHIHSTHSTGYLKNRPLITGWNEDRYLLLCRSVTRKH
jgi:para-nitrobenzyl esterase